MANVGMTFRIEGLNLNNVDLRQALAQAGAVVESAAKENAPVDTGELRNSISYEVNGRDSVSIGTNLEYGPYIEWGSGLFAEEGDGRQDVPWHYQSADGEWHTTSGQHPQPFLRPAFEDTVDDVKRVLAENIKKALTTR